MINIIICDDNYRDANKIEKMVKKIMHNVEHKIHVHNDYDKNFLNIVNSELSNKIYLLDIEVPTMSGIDVARLIRKSDFTSVIIFLSGHDDMSRTVAKKNLMCLNFINKFDDLYNNLSDTLKLALTIVGKKRYMRLVSKGTIYNINLEKILYITRDTFSRESIIVCDNMRYGLRMNMKDILNQLDEDFIQIHRACYANKNRISKIDLKDMCLTFDNGEVTTLISKKFIEGMVFE